MSANYWESTQRHQWLFTKNQLASMRQKLEDDNADLIHTFPLPQPRHLSIFFNQRESSDDPLPSLSVIPSILCD